MKWACSRCCQCSGHALACLDHFTTCWIPACFPPACQHLRVFVVGLLSAFQSLLCLMHVLLELPRNLYPPGGTWVQMCKSSSSLEPQSGTSQEWFSLSPELPLRTLLGIDVTFFLGLFSCWVPLLYSLTGFPRNPY